MLAKHGFKVDRIDGLKVYVIEKLKKYWSPIAIAGRWTLEHPTNKITKEAIYAWIYGPEGKALGMPKLLPRAKPKRGLVRAKKSKNHIPDRVPLKARSDNANARSELGHLEGDLIFHISLKWVRNFVPLKTGFERKMIVSRFNILRIEKIHFKVIYVLLIFIMWHSL